MATILKRNADLLPGQIYSCDICETHVDLEEAEANLTPWLQRICNRCARTIAASNPGIAHQAIADAIDTAHPSAPPDVRSELIEAEYQSRYGGAT